jgi:ubiquinone/menaquinone biosynthesis C-methylase UbiE
MAMKSSPRLLEYYQAHFAEHDRLTRREGQLELVRTKELMVRYLPQAPAKVIDIGGGTGIHAQWLASLGYEIHLVDIVPSHVDAARSIGTFSAALDDARSLSAPDESYDVALILGPLYHLRDLEERRKALFEAGRVLRPGGTVFAAFITRASVVLDSYLHGWIDKPGAVQKVAAALRNGKIDGAETGFGSVSYFHMPSEARDELASAGLDVQGIFGVEGPGWLAADFEDRWRRMDDREAILETARMCEAEPELQSLSAHLLGVCRRS